VLRTPTVPHAVRRVLAALATALTAALALTVLAGPAEAVAAQDGPQVHHVLPENGAVLRMAPDHFEIMFDVELVPGRVVVGIAPDDTGRLVALPASPVLDGPLLVQPLPPLPAGRYTVGVQLLGADGRVSRGTFGFAVDPASAPPTGSPGPASWLVPVIGAALLLPAAGWVRRRRTRLTPPPPAADAAPAGPERGAGRTPTSASSRGARPGR
jgi:methionine-rich copper-binding protein CopC